MSSKEEQETLRRLVQHVSRAFYEPKLVVIMDQLARHAVLKDDDLAGRIGLQAKELTKLMTALSNDRLVDQFRQNELKDGAQRSVAKQYWYIDYTNFCNVVKWRVAEMRRVIDKTLRNELDSKGYVCPQCKKTFNTLEVDRLLDMTAMTFVCDVCRHELIDNEDADAVRGSRDRMERFNHQMRFILAGLRASEEMVMPRLDIAAYVKQHLVQAEADRQEKMGGPSGTGAAGSGGRGHGELRIAGQDGNSVKDEGVGIVISGGVDEDRVRAERNRAAEAKKVQNALPAWHLQSTISGDLTALGVAERARAEAAEAQRAAVASAGSDDALRGLGTINGRLSDTKMDSMISMPADVKPATSVVDDYYASLTNPASQPYTSGTSTNPEELGDDDEDIKPDITQLMHTSLNDYRKRARSPDDIEDATTPASKTARLDDPAASAELFESTDLSGDQPAEDDPTVYVNGEAMPYSAVTEEHHDLMTPEEYAAYFVIFDSRF